MAQQILSQSIPGGIDFKRIDYSTGGVSGAKFPVGSRAIDHMGQIYRYTKFTAQFAIADADVFSQCVSFTRTFATPAVGDCDGVVTDLVGALSGATGQVDGFLERKVAGAGANQFAQATPTSTNPAFAWVKTKGVAIKAPITGAVAANTGLARLLAASLLVGTSGVALETQIGYSLEAEAAGAANIAFDCD